MVKDMIKKDYEIITDRLLLRAPRMDDAVMINAAMNDVWHDLQMWMSWAYDGNNTLESTKAWIETVDCQIKNGGYPLIGLCHETGKFVVATGITAHEDMPTTGYWVAKEFLGRGYATESANATIRFAFSEINYNVMGIEYFEGNHKSRHIIEKLGFTHLKTLPKAHKRCLNGELLDIHHYVMRDATVLPPLDVRW